MKISYKSNYIILYTNLTHSFTLTYGTKYNKNYVSSFILIISLMNTVHNENS